MWLFASKYLAEIIYPFNQALVLLLLALWWLWRGKRRACGVALILAFLLLSVPATPRFAHPFIAFIERQYPSRPIQDYPEADAIVVLGGSVKPARPPRLEPEELGEARLTQAIRLYQAGKADTIVASAGMRYAGGDGSTRAESEDIRDLLVLSGVPASAILLETESRNTHENAALTAALLRKEGKTSILLVTSALHLWRSVALFEKQGLRVTPVPSSHLVVDSEGEGRDWFPHVATLRFSSMAIKEVVGYWVYRLTGDL